MLRGLKVYYSPKIDQLFLFDEEGRYIHILVDQLRKDCLGASKGASVFTRSRKNALPKHFVYIGKYGIGRYDR